MEGETLGKLIFYVALLILLILIITEFSQGQFNLLEKLEGVLRFK